MMERSLRKDFLLIIGMMIGLTAYYFGSIYLAAYVIDNPIFDHTNYIKLENWDLGGYVQDIDIDGDGAEDFVHSVGCAYLSKAVIEDIPEDKKCKVDGSAVLPTGLPEYGQKYMDLPTTSANWDEQARYLNAFGYAYAFENEGQWFIAEKRGFFYKLRIFSIQGNGLLTQSDVPFKHHIFAWLYIATNILVIPVFFIAIGLSFISSWA